MKKSGEPTAAAADAGAAKNEVAAIEAQIHRARRALGTFLVICLASIACIIIFDINYGEEHYNYTVKENWKTAKTAATGVAIFTGSMVYIFFIALIVGWKKIRNVQRSAKETVSS